MSSLGTAAQFIFSSGPFARGDSEVDGARDELLAGAALAGDEHGRRALRGARDLLDELLHRAALADELAGRAARGAELAGLGLGAHQAERGLDARGAARRC